MYLIHKFSKVFNMSFLKVQRLVRHFSKFRDQIDTNVKVQRLNLLFKLVRSVVVVVVY